MDNPRSRTSCAPTLHQRRQVQSRKPNGLFVRLSTLKPGATWGAQCQSMARPCQHDVRPRNLRYRRSKCTGCLIKMFISIFIFVAFRWTTTNQEHDLERVRVQTSRKSFALGFRNYNVLLSSFSFDVLNFCSGCHRKKVLSRKSQTRTPQTKNHVDK